MKILARLLSAAVLSSVAMVGISQANDTGRVLVASNTLQLSADTERSSSDDDILKKFVVPFAGTVRVRWQSKSDGSAPVLVLVESALGSVTPPDICGFYTESTTYQWQACTLRVLEGDVIEVRAGAASGTLISLRNVRVYYDVVNNPGTIKKLP